MKRGRSNNILRRNQISNVISGENIKGINCPNGPHRLRIYILGYMPVSNRMEYIEDALRRDYEFNRR